MSVFKRLLTLASLVTSGCVVLSALLSENAQAFSVNVTYTDTPKQCEDPANTNLTEEFDPNPPFPALEHFLVNVAPYNGISDCFKDIGGNLVPVGEQGGGNDYQITITNKTGFTVNDLFVAADDNVLFANFDGLIAGNRAKFIVDSLANNANSSFFLMDSNVIPSFASLGVPSGGQAGANSTYSIVGNKVPEPSLTLSILAFSALGAASTLKRKLKSSQSTEKETTKVG